MLDTDGPGEHERLPRPDERWIGPPDRPTVSRVPVLVLRRALADGLAEPESSGSETKFGVMEVSATPG
jgi:hypothetical protein